MAVMYVLNIMEFIRKRSEITSNCFSVHYKRQSHTKYIRTQTAMYSFDKILMLSKMSSVKKRKKSDENSLQRKWTQINLFFEDF